MGKTTIGRRVYDTEVFAPGDYGKHPVSGEWYACPPGDHLGCLSEHDVVEHEDGTITVSPSILISDDKGERWHGYLRRGVWEEC